MFTAAIFDMDGLLIDSERALLRVWTQVAEEMGATLAEADFVRMVGLGTIESNHILMEIFGTETRVRSMRERAADLLRPGGELPLFPLRPGARDLLDLLQANGVPCAVASSTRVSEVRRRLQGVGVLDRFVSLAGGDEVTRSKPDPGVFLLAAQRLGLAPQQCLAFEDSVHGVMAARAAGMQVVMVPDLVVPDAALSAQTFALLGCLSEAQAHSPRWFAKGVD
jgi:beta-phosphoglucomutase-like phosphatase (HAD superfamily)